MINKVNQLLKGFNPLGQKKVPSDIFLKLLNFFPEITKTIIDDHFTLALQILALKYRRKEKDYRETLQRRKRKAFSKKPYAGPLLLKEKDISDSLILADFHLNNKWEINVEGYQDLMQNFGDFPLNDAIRWYDEFLVRTDTRDVMGRKVVFTENGKRFLYKEHTDEGAHVIAEENYVDPRGKRLSWIKPLLKQTKEIYRQVESSWETFLYVGVFKIRIDKNTPYEKTVNNYFLVTTRKRSGQSLEFVTAYYMEDQLELFKHLEKARPLSREQQEYIKKIEKSVDF